METALEETFPKLYRVEEIAEHMDVEAATVRRWIRERQLRGKKYGREWLVRADELEAFLSVR